jgi:hypothetical protein
MASEQPQRIVVTSTKSVGIAILLTILFGPLGMLYSTVPGGLIMLAVNAVIFLLSVFTAGFGALLFFITWPVCVVWGAIAAKSYNAKLIAGQR